jgi:hypothetical protein
MTKVGQFDKAGDTPDVTSLLFFNLIQNLSNAHKAEKRRIAG